MKLILVRHGETDWNLEHKIQGKQDIELNSTGLKQAEELGIALLAEKYNIVKIYSSTKKRAIKTAEIVSKILHMEYNTIAGLEEMNFGDWEGHNFLEIQMKYPIEYKEWFNNRRFVNTPNGESYDELLKRVISALKAIITENCNNELNGGSSDEYILVVTHGAVMMSLQAFINNTPFEEMVSTYKTGNASTVTIPVENIINL